MAARPPGLRLVLLTTRATTSYLDHRFTGRDVLLFGRESAGVPDAVHAAADARLTIPMRPGLRSLNVAMACAMVVGEGAAADARCIELTGSAQRFVDHTAGEAPFGRSG